MMCIQPGPQRRNALAYCDKQEPLGSMSTRSLGSSRSPYRAVKKATRRKFDTDCVAERALLSAAASSGYTCARPCSPATGRVVTSCAAWLSALLFCSIYGQYVSYVTSFWLSVSQAIGIVQPRTRQQRSGGGLSAASPILSADATDAPVAVCRTRLWPF